MLPVFTMKTGVGKKKKKTAKWTTSIAVAAADVKSLTVSVTANVIGRAFHARVFVLANVKRLDT